MGGYKRRSVDREEGGHLVSSASCHHITRVITSAASGFAVLQAGIFYWYLGLQSRINLLV
jgi:hypothetical protein